MVNLCLSKEMIEFSAQLCISYDGQMQTVNQVEKRYRRLEQ